MITRADGSTLGSWRDRCGAPDPKLGLLSLKIRDRIILEGQPHETLAMLHH